MLEAQEELRGTVVLAPIATHVLTERLAPGQRPSIAVNDEGLVAIVPVRDAGTIAIFQRGSREPRLLGRAGRGPAEFVMPRRVLFGHSDTVYVFDVGQRRVSTMLVTGALVDAMPLPGIPSSLHRMGEGWLFAGAIGTQAAFGFTLHILDAKGRVVRSFARQPGPVTVAEDLGRFVAIGPEASLWSLRVTRGYEVQEWISPEVPGRRVSRVPAWLSEAEGLYRARIFSVRLDGAGRLWVVGAAPSRGARGVTKDTAQYRASHSDQTEIFDTVIEVLDPTTAQLLGATRLNGLYVAVDSRLPMLARVEYDPSGETRIHISRLDLIPRED